MARARVSIDENVLARVMGIKPATKPGQPAQDEEQVPEDRDQQDKD